MPILLSVADAYGGYVSLVKLIVLLVLFLAWIPLVKWVNKDVLKECSVELSDSNLDWKQVSKGVTTKARVFWQKKMRDILGGT